MVSCSTDYVWWPNTETSSHQLPMLLQNYTHYSGRVCDVMYILIYSISQKLGKLEITYESFSDFRFLIISTALLHFC